jgi:hypothetical protein
MCNHSIYGLKIFPSATVLVLGGEEKGHTGQEQIKEMLASGITEVS